MTRIALYTSFGLIVFVASAAGSLYWQRTEKPANERQQTVAEDELQVGAPDASVDVLADAGQAKSGELPVVVRPRPASTEEILRLGATMRNREKALKAREEAIQKERSRLKLIMDDIQSERSELESLQLAIHGKFAAAEKLLGEVELQRQQLTQEREEAKRELEEIKTARTEQKEAQENNLKRMSLWIENMEPVRAADCLREMSNDGKMDMAVQLLANFEERDAAKILEAMDDALVAQLLDEFKNAKRTPKKLR
jgi:chromosome segregation ATPase